MVSSNDAPYPPRSRNGHGGPQAYAGFEGEIGRSFADSRASWPERAPAPNGSPNIVVMLVDDMGYSDIGCFGSEVPTPHIDKMAAEGLRYANFHATPKCSPTRASLLTGYNHHLAGYADVVHFDPGFPNYKMQMDPSMPTMAQRLRDVGYGTMMVGKWHLAKESEMSAEGPRESWPLQCGFDEFYGFLDGFTNMHEPHRLVEGNSILSIDSFPPDYYLTDDLTDRAIRMVRDRKVSYPERPFFLYFAHAAVHAPLHAKHEDVDRHKGRFDAGWDIVRIERHARQVASGLMDSSSVLPSNDEGRFGVPSWESLNADQKKVYARYMEVYAAVISNMDDNFGRLRAALTEMGEWENTIVLFLSDNGASSEGGATGSPCYFNEPRIGNGPISAELSRLKSLDFATSILDRIGQSDTMPHYPLGWARASNTPFRLFKKQTHAGGHHVPAVLSWPRGVPDPGGIRQQYVHVVDVLPTILELIGAHASGTESLDGLSFSQSIADADSPAPRNSQYYEMDGNRGYYEDGWEVVSRYDPSGRYSSDQWELYDLSEDPTETTDLARKFPERALELGERWESAAHRNQVFPLSDGSGLDELLRPATESRYDRPLTIWGGASTLDRYRSRLLVQIRSFSVEIRLASPFRSGDEGVLVAHGDQGGGYLVYVENGSLWYGHTFALRTRLVEGPAVPEGALDLRVDFEAQLGAQWSVTLGVGQRSQTIAEKFDMLWGVTPFQGIDVGIDRGSPVSRDIRKRHGTFAYSGGVSFVNYIPGEVSPESPFKGSPEEARRTFRALERLHD